ncbi:Protein kinase domain-containing protein [Caenorhabditis elegans]|uniref:Protein kinase domain-containing protein n=1 Tax=Caenorhabditis elegans TaxID=6239 RepID=Q18765_CAEEL|nr:Protein kinase domain-containing protein [Caenorhabditis elegans]CAA98255.2 Protein kinase domain-containing protein [Caenorhabditis elegans]|eukprot:NP_505555.2 Uncharacterized protein CELE_C50H2.7 [Caenorhabditis elegans]
MTPNVMRLLKACFVEQIPDEVCDEFHLKKDTEHMILITKDGGMPISKIKPLSDSQVLSVLSQILLSLYIGKRELQFSHNDLNPGNLLISETKKKSISYKKDGKSIKIKSHGRFLTLIDLQKSTFDEKEDKGLDCWKLNSRVRDQFLPLVKEDTKKILAKVAEEIEKTTILDWKLPGMLPIQ